MLPRALRSYCVASSVLFVLSVLCMPRAVAAATFTVNRTLDLPDISPGDGVCAAGPSIPGVPDACTLRAAIMEANALGGTEPHVINLPEGIFELTRVRPDPFPGLTEDDIQLSNSEGAIDHDGFNDLDIGVSVEIIGVGEGRTIVQARGQDRVFHVLHRSRADFRVPAHVRLARLTVRGGSSVNRGSGIFFERVREAILDDVTVEENRGPALFHHDGVNYTAVGGGVHSQARDLFVNRSTMRNNIAGAGGGLLVFGGWATVRDSTFSGNIALNTGGGSSTLVGGLHGMGGGIAVFDTPASRTVLDLRGSTLTGNRALDGGGLAAWGHAQVVNSTLSGNSATSRGGGAYVRTPPAGGLSQFEFTTVVNNTADTGGGVYREQFERSSFTLVRSIVALNSPENCAPPAGARPLSGGHNLEDTSTCGFTFATDLPNQAPRLGPLADNGGETETHALLSGSPAIDRAGTSAYHVDQRGVRRPQGSAMDIGAVENLRFSFTPYRIPDRFNIVFGFSLTLEITGTSGATIRSIAAGSPDMKLTVKMDKSGRIATVSASGLNIDVDKLKQTTGQKRPVLFYVEVDAKGEGSEFVVIAEPRFDAVIKDVTKLPIDQK